VLEARKVGIILNTTGKDGNLKAEAWLEESRLKKVDNRILEKLQKGEMVELSTGLYADCVAEAGLWNGEEYSGIAKNFRPDHLAILPDQKGACSIADGAGLLRNEASYDAKRALIRSALTETLGIDAGYFVEDVFASFFIYYKGGKLWKQDYIATDTKATISGTPMEVVRVVQYRSPDGAVVANIERSLNVKKMEMIALLVSTSGGLFSEADREYLERQEDTRLQMFINSVKKEQGAPKEPVTNKDKTPEAPTPKPTLSLADYLAAAPEEYREVLASGIRIHQEQKAKVIQEITSNKANIFPLHTLQAKSFEELQALAALANAGKPSPSFAGLGDVGTPFKVEEEPYSMPVMSFAKK
jgi:hypothetical protein